MYPSWVILTNARIRRAAKHGVFFRTALSPPMWPHSPRYRALFFLSHRRKERSFAVTGSIPSSAISISENANALSQRSESETRAMSYVNTRHPEDMPHPILVYENSEPPQIRNRWQKVASSIPQRVAPLSSICLPLSYQPFILPSITASKKGITRE